MWKKKFGSGRQKREAAPCRINWCDNPLCSESPSEDEDEEQEQQLAQAPAVVPAEGYGEALTPVQAKAHAQRQRVNMKDRPLPPVPAQLPGASGTSTGITLEEAYASEPWYHGTLSRQETEEVLSAHGLSDGLFLVRKSPRRANVFVVSLCYKGKVYHNSVRVQVDGHLCYVGPERVFSSLPALVDFYTNISSVPHLKLTRHAPVGL